MTTTSFDYSLLDAAVRDEVRKAAERIRGEIKRTAQGVLTIGKELLAVREKVGHGNWEKWLTLEFGMGRSTAKNFMQVARRFSKSPKFGDLPVAVLYELANASDEAVEEVMQEATQQQPTNSAGNKPKPKLVTLATARAAKKKHPAPPKPGKKRGRPLAMKAAKEPTVRPPSPLERVARAYQLPADTFMHRKETEDAKQVTLYLRGKVFETAKRNAEASGISLNEVVAEAIAIHAAPAPEKQPLRNLGEIYGKNFSQFGEGAGIDYDGEYRHVRLPNVEGRRVEWLGQHFGDVVTAMRDFIRKVPPGVTAEHAQKWLTHDPNHSGPRQQRLAKAKAAFVPLAQEVLAVLKELEQVGG